MVFIQLQVMQSKLGPNFKGIPFENFEDEAELFRKRWNSTMDYYKKYIQRDLSRKKPEKVEHHIEKLMSEKMLCSHDYPGLMAKIATHPPRLRYKPS